MPIYRLILIPCQHLAVNASCGLKQKLPFLANEPELNKEIMADEAVQPLLLNECSWNHDVCNLLLLQGISTFKVYMCEEIINLADTII